MTITRNGREAAVLISPVDLAGLEETLAVLSDPAALAEIREADAAYAQGNVVRLPMANWFCRTHRRASRRSRARDCG